MRHVGRSARRRIGMRRAPAVVLAVELAVELAVVLAVLGSTLPGPTTLSATA